MPIALGLFVRGLSKRSWVRSRCLPFLAADPRRRLLPLAVVSACSVLVLQPAAAQEVPGEYPQCISELWAAGSQLGAAEAIARHEAPSDDARMLESVHAAGKHLERAYELCPNRPDPWPAWSNWSETQNQLTEMSDKFRDGRMNRDQLAIALSAVFQSLAPQLAYRRVLPTHIDRDTSCVEIYMRLGNALGFAQAVTESSRRLVPDATLRLRKSLSLIYQMRDMPQPCRDFQGLIPAINEALSRADDPSIVGRVDAILHAGEVVAGPSQ
jgi:hypothetical protein